MKWSGWAATGELAAIASAARELMVGGGTRIGSRFGDDLEIY
jgi:hypothetical protein